jgi:hypothetical protein
MTKPKVTGKVAAAKSAKVVWSISSSRTAKSASGSALSQASSPKRQTSSAAASAAGRTLKDPRASKAAKSAAARALALRTVKSSAKTGRVSRSAAKSAVQVVTKART